MDIEKIKSEYATIQGRRFMHDGVEVIVEDLIGTESDPRVLLSNDQQISLFEAMNMVPAKVKEYTEHVPSGGYFPDVQFDDGGVPIVDSIAQNPAEMDEVLHRTESMQPSQPVVTNPLVLLLATSKKVTASFQLEFECERINASLYDVLSESYGELLDEAVIADIKEQINKVLDDVVKNNLKQIFHGSN